jgi:hypothetical protein
MFNKDVRNTCQVFSCWSQEDRSHTALWAQRLLVCKPAGIFSNIGEHKESCWFCLHIFFASAEGSSPCGSLWAAFHLILRLTMSLPPTSWAAVGKLFYLLLIPLFGNGSDHKGPYFSGWLWGLNVILQKCQIICKTLSLNEGSFIQNLKEARWGASSGTSQLHNIWQAT